jgi:hypothetical protein
MMTTKFDFASDRPNYRVYHFRRSDLEDYQPHATCKSLRPQLWSRPHDASDAGGRPKQSGDRRWSRRLCHVRIARGRRGVRVPFY